MANYYLESIQSNPEQLFKGSWIMLYHADRIPPHLVMIHDGLYYSLSVNGSKIAEPLDSLLRAIQAKNHHCVLFNVDLSSSAIKNKQALLSKYFEHYLEPEEGQVTCLFPIRAALTELLNQYFERCEFVFDLYSELKSKQLTTINMQLNMQALLDEKGGFTLPTYTREAIDNCIAELKSAHVER